MARETDSAGGGFRVGERLKQLRQKFGYSQRELARRCDMTNGALSNIEQEKVSPSILTLEKIVGAFSMSLTEFFSLDLGQSQAVYAVDDFVHIHKNETEQQILPLPELGKEGGYLARLRYAPGARISSEWMVQRGYVAGVVMDGELVMHLDGVEYLLTRGQGFYFSHHRLHSFHNASTLDCIVATVAFSA